MRDKQSKFQSPLEMDLPLPSLGADYMNVSKADFQYCRSSTNMWLSPSGNLETRPSLVPLFKGAGRVTGLLYSRLLECILVVFKGFREVDGTWSVVDSNNLYKWENDTLTFVGELSGTNDKVRMVEFINKVMIASGGTLQYYDGTSFGVYSVYPGSIPIPEMDYVDTWQERLWGFKGSHLYGSGYREAGDYGTANGTASVPGGGQVEIRPDDGSDISGFCIFQGNIYITKASGTGNRSSFWVMTGTSFNASSSDPFTIKLVNDGLGCVNPFTMTPVSNTVMFMGDDGRVYSETLIDNIALPQATPVNMRVMDAFKGDNTAIMATYQARLGYYFLLMNNDNSGYFEIWSYHTGTQGWWRWELINSKPTFACQGVRDQLLIGDLDGVVSFLDTTKYGTDGGNNVTKIERYTSGLSFGIIDANSTRDKFFEWLFVDYLPIGDSGQMWVDYREGRGYTYAYTASVLSAESGQNARTVGWDFAVSQWDVPEVGWDMGGTIEVMNRINRRTNTLQIALYSNTAFRLTGVAITGGMIATKFRGWYRK